MRHEVFCFYFLFFLAGKMDVLRQYEKMWADEGGKILLLFSDVNIHEGGFYYAYFNIKNLYSI